MGDDHLLNSGTLRYEVEFVIDLSSMARLQTVSGHFERENGRTIWTINFRFWHLTRSLEVLALYFIGLFCTHVRRVCIWFPMALMQD